MNKLLITGLLITFALPSIAQDSASLERKREETYRVLLNYRNCLYLPCKNNTYLPFDKTYFNDKSRDRLFELLENRWTKEERTTLSTRIIQDDLNKQINGIKQMLNDSNTFRFNKARKQSYLKRLDSLEMVSSSGNPYPPASILDVEQRLMNAPVPVELILKAGMLDMMELSPTLEKEINNPQYDREAVELVISRLKVDYKTTLDKNRVHSIEFQKMNTEAYMRARAFQYKSGAKLIYICSQESILEYSNFLDFDFFSPAHEEDVTFYPIPSYSIEMLLKVISNSEFQSYFKQVETIPSDITVKHVKWAKKWLKNNYGKYELVRNYYPGRELQ